ncbi:MAG TPA: hypothetical protein VK400_19405 [Pyrinomonadaceae bacterium]|nr:hypothetical protein [Pyrinomonadaceae bacterium]
MSVNRKRQAKMCEAADSVRLMMRIQTFSALCLLAFLFLFQAHAAAQEQVENSQAPRITQTTKFDEFGPVGDCDLGGRLDNLLVALRDNPAAKGYIIFYRGADDEPAMQDKRFAVGILTLYANHLRLRRFPKEGIEMADGGFRASRMTELWFVPPGGEIPQPSGTVEKPEQPKNKALMVERNYLDLSEAALPPPEEEAVPETDTQEVQQETVENQDASAETETETQTEAEIVPEEEFFEWTSVYFAETLNQDKSARGRVIYYADEAEYDLTKASEVIERGMRDLAEKTNLDLSRVKIVFGGYRESSEVEFWIVPRGAKKPKPTPQERKIKEEIKTEN